MYCFVINLMNTTQLKLLCFANKTWNDQVRQKQIFHIENVNLCIQRQGSDLSSTDIF